MVLTVSKDSDELVWAATLTEGPYRSSASDWRLEIAFQEQGDRITDWSKPSSFAVLLLQAIKQGCHCGQIHCVRGQAARFHGRSVEIHKPYTPEAYSAMKATKRAIFAMAMVVGDSLRAVLWCGARNSVQVWRLTKVGKH